MEELELPIPIEKKKIDCLIYFSLCRMAFRDGNEQHRYIKKKDFVKTKILTSIKEVENISDETKKEGGKEYTMDRLRTAISGLEKNEYITYDDKKERYIISKGESYTTISTKLYEYFLNTGNKDVIMVYAIVKNFHVGGTFYINGVIKQMGLTNTGRNYRKVRDILERLSNDGLLGLEEYISVNEYKVESSMFKITSINDEAKSSIKKIRVK